MSDKVILFTGAGGFIGRYVLGHYLKDDGGELYLLNTGRSRARLERFIDAAVSNPKRRAQVHIIEGDIAAAGLGIDATLQYQLKERVTHVMHLAALYNLSAPREVSIRVNVEGTRNVLDFVEAIKPLRRFGYMSTVAVSGDYLGLFTEDDLEKGQRFKNFYAESKFLAEQLVRERWRSIPTVICRPTIVVGDTQTGAIDKIDGPYFGLTMILRYLHLLTVNTGEVKCHMAPVDFIADAFRAIFEAPDTEGNVYCLGDPHPLAYVDFYNVVCERWGKLKPLIHLPVEFMRPALRLPYFYEITGVTPEAFEYSVNPVEYSMTNAEAVLSKYNIACPSVLAYLDVMLKYFREHHRDPELRPGNWKS